jgi:hypothetical protein
MESKPRPTIASSTMVNWLGFRSNVALGMIWSVLVANCSTGCAESETAEELLDMKGGVLTQLPVKWWLSGEASINWEECACVLRE